MDTKDLRTSTYGIDHTTMLKLLRSVPTKDVVDFWRQMHQSDEPMISNIKSPYVDPLAEHPVFTGNPDAPFGTEMSHLDLLHSLLLNYKK